MPADPTTRKDHPTMKSLFSALIAFAISSITSFGAAAPQGFIIYTDPPSDFVSGAEFTSYLQSNWRYSTIVKADGVQEQVQNSGIIGIINYPVGQPDQADATQVLQSLQGLQRKCPQPEFRAYFQSAYARWQNALALSKQQRKQAAVADENPVKGNTPSLSLVVNGTNYDDVALTSADDDSAGITHSAGVARIPLAALSKEQITELNNTSAATKIAPDWRAKEEAAHKAAEAAAKLAQARAAADNDEQTSGPSGNIPSADSKNTAQIGSPLSEFIARYGDDKGENARFPGTSMFIAKGCYVYVIFMEGKAEKIFYETCGEITKEYLMEFLHKNSNGGLTWQENDTGSLPERYPFMRSDSESFAGVIHHINSDSSSEDIVIVSSRKNFELEVAIEKQRAAQEAKQRQSEAQESLKGL